MYIHLCRSCRHFNQIQLDPYRHIDAYGRRTYVEETFEYTCKKKLGYVRTLRKSCKDYLSINQTKLFNGGDKMVKISDMERVPQRRDLNDLQPEMELLAIREKVVKGQAGKAGGLQITYLDRANLIFPQKYTNTMLPKLIDACIALKIDDTEELQKHWYKCKLTKMGQWFPRMIPVKRLEAKAKVELKTE